MESSVGVDQLRDTMNRQEVGFGKVFPTRGHSTQVSNDLITFDETFESDKGPSLAVLSSHALSKCGLTSWNLKFDGHGDVIDFISAVEELQVARGIPEKLLLSNFHDLLSEPILTWFRVNRFQFTSWRRLKALLYENFLPTDYTYRETSQLRAKKQSVGQSLWEYISQMRFLANKVPNSLTDSDLFEIVKHNILPKYHAALIYGSVFCLDDLVRVGRLTDAYSSDPVNNSVHNPVNNDVSNSHSLNEARPVLRRQQLAIRAVTSGDTSRSVSGACFVCKEVGHFSKQCPMRALPLEGNCFKCQQWGHRYNKCPNIRPLTSLRVVRWNPVVHASPSSPQKTSCCTGYACQ